MKFLFLFFFHSLAALPAIVFVHLGPTLPPYVETAVEQAHLFNPTLPIYLIANQHALTRWKGSATPIAAETLPCEQNHQFFKAIPRHPQENFWRYATERFFYLYAFMKQREIDEVFHLENDNLLYADLQELHPLFQKYYPGQMAITMDSDNRCIAGFVYIGNPEALKEFTYFVTNRGRYRSTDMELLAQFRHSSNWAGQLPIIMPQYAADHPLISPHGRRGTNSAEFTQHYDAFQGFFDAAAIGQYLGGDDPMHGNPPGFINESCIFNPSYLQYIWELDDQGRLIPYAIYKDQKAKLINLHIHCKDLNKFKSTRKL